ncbi:Mitochondrial distribution and morphology protein 10 [Actinomortierella ambigua]|uniref:Mitochondrial distribution and morphology protein 10 n=1 Tax=Actinomortierella ambigua TaxID=1343610 RepID=A0A9P6U0U0_9FUNG|nr:Mitochondrial distribution and morphology protein 10 [Actinomortierella ambigua]
MIKKSSPSAVSILASYNSMYDFMEYCLRRYYRASGWNEDNQYSHLCGTSRALLDFQVPKGLSLRLSKLPSSVFKTTSTMNALPILDGSIGYLFTSRPLPIDDSASVRFRHMVDRFRIICLDHGIREADQWSEIGPDGKRRKDYLLSGRLNLANARLEALYSRRVSKHRQYVISGVSDPASKAASYISAQYQYDKGKYCAEVSFTTDDGLIGVRGLYNFGQDFDYSYQTMHAERRHRALDLQAGLDQQQRALAEVMGMNDEERKQLKQASLDSKDGDDENEREEVGNVAQDNTRSQQRPSKPDEEGHHRRDQDLVPRLKESARMMMVDSALGSSAALDDDVDLLEEVVEEAETRLQRQRPSSLQFQHGPGQGRAGQLRDGTADEQQAPEDEWAEDSDDRSRGYWSAGAEVYYSATEKLGGVSMGLRYRSLPPLTASSASADGHPYPTSTGPEHHQHYIPVTLTQTLNPIMGHVSSSYAAQVNPDLGLCSRFDFNLYSYDSELTVGLEWWLREKRGFVAPSSSAISSTSSSSSSSSSSAIADANDASLVKTLEERHEEQRQLELLEAEAAVQSRHPHVLAPVIGVLKARLGVQSGLAILWEGRFNKLLFSFGVVADMSSVGLSAPYAVAGARRAPGLSSASTAAAAVAAASAGLGAGGRPSGGVNVRSIGLEIQYFS